MKTSLSIVAAITLFALMQANAVAQSDTLQKYITDDFVTGFVAKPARLLRSRYAAMLIEAADPEKQFDQRMKELKDGVGFDPRETDEVIMLLDRKTIFNMAGLPAQADATDEPAKPAAVVLTVSRVQQQNNLKQMGLAMHNFHDIYNGFPDDDGSKETSKGNLSWRVHLLPLMEQNQLYQEFHLDEPWDSEHNKTLIPRMPKLFITNGVKAKGKTSVHVMNSEGTMFGGDQEPRLRDITDGTSNTMMFVVAGADKAETWTKPGGLELKPGAPKESLGNIGQEFFVCRADGSVQALPADFDADNFRRLAQHRDGEVIDDEPATPIVRHLPTWIIRSTVDIDQQAIFASLTPMGNPVQIDFPGGRLHTLGDYAISFPDKRTLVAAPAELLPKMLKASATANSPLAVRLKAAAGKSDFTFVADLQSLETLKQELAGNLPMAGVVQSVNVIEASLDVAGTSQYLQQVTAEMQNPVAAAQLSALLTGMMQMQKAQLLGLANNPNSPLSPKMIETLTRLYDRTEVKADGQSVHYRLPKPKDMDAFTKELMPAVKQLFGQVTQARVAARGMQRKNDIKLLGLAFHNYHDVYRAFPRHGGDGAERQDGLSWRVHLLPFIEEAGLYDRFHRDEPWDSEHNKALIAEMPELFRSPGVDKPGYTSIHVFTGMGTPFNDGTKAPGIRDFTDGTSNTLLAVDAGPDTAAVWTKPGGLEFTGDNGRKLLGKIGDTFLGLMTDGSVRSISADIDADTLHNLIQHQDGNPLGEY